jgi:hypothetical protein
VALDDEIAAIFEDSEDNGLRRLIKKIWRALVHAYTCIFKLRRAKYSVAKVQR